MASTQPKKIECPRLWHGLVPPQYVFARRKFKCIVLDPPNFSPGSWIGAGKAVYDDKKNEFLLTARPRKAEGRMRGFAANIYRSEDGEKFELVTSISKEDVSRKSNLRIHSIEGTQLLKDPLTGKWHFYLSVDTTPKFVWGGLYWQTLLLTGSSLEGPWESEGLVLQNGPDYDTNQARDATIDIVDGRWFCIYKAINKSGQRRPALATSTDGIFWRKHGVFTIDDSDQLTFLSGTIFSGTCGPVFMGVEKRPEQLSPNKEGQVYADKYKVSHGAGSTFFAAYSIDYRNMNLETIFRARWEPKSEYEHKEQPLLGYSSLVYDPIKKRMLTYVEAIDGVLTKKMGINETVERVLLYETML